MVMLLVLCCNPSGIVSYCYRDCNVAVFIPRNPSCPVDTGFATDIIPPTAAGFLPRRSNSRGFRLLRGLAQLFFLFVQPFFCLPRGIPAISTSTTPIFFRERERYRGLRAVVAVVVEVARVGVGLAHGVVDAGAAEALLVEDLELVHLGADGTALAEVVVGVAACFCTGVAGRHAEAPGKVELVGGGAADRSLQIDTRRRGHVM